MNEEMNGEDPCKRALLRVNKDLPNKELSIEGTVLWICHYNIIERDNKNPGPLQIN